MEFTRVAVVQQRRIVDVLPCSDDGRSIDILKKEKRVEKRVEKRDREKKRLLMSDWGNVVAYTFHSVSGEEPPLTNPMHLTLPFNQLAASINMVPDPQNGSQMVSPGFTSAHLWEEQS
jgi:hypothetical protein